MSEQQVVPPMGQANEDLSKFALTSPIDVQHVLRGLIKSSSMVSIYFNNDSDFLVTTLLDMDAKKGQLIFDVGGDAEANKKLQSAAECNFTSSPDGVKIQFSTKKAAATTWKGNAAFVVALPTKLIKLQRREYYRIQTPIINPLSCTLRHPILGVVKLKLFDLSLGGVGLILPSAENHAPFEVFSDCRLDLHDFGDAQVDLQSRNIITIPLKNGKQMVRMGCRFIKLPSRQETLLQRVITQLERERNVPIGG
jgi:c-di-GMP-binding flagellar brake protein YcgR